MQTMQNLNLSAQQSAEVTMNSNSAVTLMENEYMSNHNLTELT